MTREEFNDLIRSNFSPKSCGQCEREDNDEGCITCDGFLITDKAWAEYSKDEELAKYKKIIDEIRKGDACPPSKDANDPNCFCPYEFTDEHLEEVCTKCWDDYIEDVNDEQKRKK